MKIYKRNLRKSAYCLFIIAADIFVALFLIYIAITMPEKLSSLTILQSILVIAGVNFMAVPLLHYIILDDNEIKIPNLILKSRIKAYQYNEIDEIIFTYYKLEGVAMRIKSKGVLSPRYLLLLIDKNDIGLIINELRNKGVTIDCLKVPKKYLISKD